MTSTITQIEPVVYVVNDTSQMVGELVHNFGHQTRIFNCSTDFLEGIDSTRPGCVVLDLQLPEADRLAVHQRLQQRDSALPMILVTDTASTSLTVRSLRNGALTVLEKPISDDELENSIQEAIRRSVEEHARQRHLESLERRLKRLSPQDRQVLQFMLQGYKNRSIAKELDVSLRTVENRRRRVFEVMRADSVAQLTRMIVEYEHSLLPASAKREGWLQLPFEKFAC